MKICLALTLVLQSSVEGRGVKNFGHGVKVTLKDAAVPVIHTVAAETGQSHHVVAKVAGKGNIVPPLVDVDTDKKFFGPPFPADYPTDVQPPAKKGLFKKDSVYPKVQEEGFFDKDYTQDENSDGGEWQAQSDYDAARTKIVREKSQAKNAVKRAANERKDVGKAAAEVAKRKKEEEVVAKEAKQAREEADAAAAGAAERAKKKVDEKRAEAHAATEKEKEEEEEKRRSLEKRVQAAEEELKKEREDYKGCLRQLQEAKAKVEELERQKAQLKKGGRNTTKMVVAETEDVESEKKAVQEAKARSAVAASKHEEAEKKLKAAHDASEAAKHKLDQQKIENEKAQLAIKHEEADIKQAEKDLANSKANLRRIRGLDAVPGEHPKEPQHAVKAGAVSMKTSILVAVVLAASMIL